MAMAIPLIAGSIGAWLAPSIGLTAAIGWGVGEAVGSIIEQSMFGREAPPNALTDLHVQTAAWGTGIPQIFGTQRVAGNIIWATDKQLVGGDQGKFGSKGGGGGKSGGGKGKKGTGSQGYYVTAIAFALCEGSIGGIKRIWAGGDLIFDDGHPVYVPSMDPNKPKGGYSVFTANNQPIYSTGGSALGTWTLYHGTALQTADATIAANGSANGANGVPYQKTTLQNGFTYSYGSPQYGKMGTACAYRGVAYIVFPALNCGYGGSIPPLTFEVVETGSLDSPSAIVPATQLPVERIACGNVNATGDYALLGAISATGTDCVAINLATQSIALVTNPYIFPPSGANPQNYVILPGGTGFASVAGFATFSVPPQSPFFSGVLASDDYYGQAAWVGACATGGGTIWALNAQNYACSPSKTSGTDAFGLNGPSGSIYPPEMIRYPLPSGYLPTFTPNVLPVVGGLFYYFSGTTLVACSPPQFTPIATTLPSAPSTYFTDGQYIYADVGGTIYQVNPTSGAASVYMTIGTMNDSNFYLFANGWLYGLQNNTLLKYNPNGTVRASADTGLIASSNNPIIQTNAGLLVSGQFLTSVYGAYSILSFGDMVITPQPPTLPQVCQAICARASFTNVDVSELPALPVNLTRSAGTSARDILKVLGQVYQFDMVDSAGLLRFVPKGQNIVAQLSYDDIGVAKPTNGTPGAPYAWTRTQGTDLPRSVAIKYTSALANYNQSTQFFQLHDNFGKDVTVAVPLTLDDRTAITAAMLLTVEPHIERTAYSWTCDFTKLAYEPGDVVQMPWGVTRITQVQLRQTDKEPVVDFQGVIDASYVIYSGNGNSAGVALPQLGQPSTYLPALPTQNAGSLLASMLQPGSITIQPPTKPPPNVGNAYVALVEVPPLTSQQTSPFYLAAPWSTGNVFAGAALFESTDGGQTFNQLGQQAQSGIVGWANAVLPATQPYTWDTTSTVDIYLNATYMQLSGATDLQVIQGGNLALCGGELIQFGNATLMTDPNGHPFYRLSRLLRGRRATDNMMASHILGEQFVLIQPGDETSISYGLHDINNANEFKVATVGQEISTIPEQAFSPTGLWYRPFPPAHPMATVDASNDWNVAFFASARLNGWWGSGYTATLDPDTQTWSADILNGTAVVRTVTGNLATPSFQYTAAQQSADGFTPGQHGITMNIYEVGQLGRGRAATVTT